MSLHAEWEDAELPGVRLMLDRAMNCWTPEKQPAWLQRLSDAVDARLVKIEASLQAEFVLKSEVRADGKLVVTGVGPWDPNELPLQVRLAVNGPIPEGLTKQELQDFSVSPARRAPPSR